LKARGIDVRAIGVDLHPNALSLARENVQRCSLESSIKIIEADVFQEDFVARMKGEMGGTFDLVISNPPYITRKDYESLPSSVKDWEDRGALVGEDEGGVDDGLVFYERITGIAKELLREEGGEGPVLALEVGMGQSKRVGEMVERQGMRSEVAKDQWEIERLVLGWRD
jgi:release factor glutamine methyltransferase